MVYDLRQGIACHVGLGKCSFSNNSHQGCHSVREAFGIWSGDSLEDSIPGQARFLF